MKHFFINQLPQKEVEQAINQYGKGYTEGHKKEHALQKHFNRDYIFYKDNLAFYKGSDIPLLRASVKSANCTLYTNGKIIKVDTPVKDAIKYYINTDASNIYYIVLEPKKWCKELCENEYVIIELNKNEMENLLNEYACTDRDGKSKNVKNCLRLKRTDDVIYKWYLMNRL